MIFEQNDSCDQKWFLSQIYQSWYYFISILGGKTIDIQNYVFKNHGKKYLGTAFPDIWSINTDNAL